MVSLEKKKSKYKIAGAKFKLPENYIEEWERVSLKILCNFYFIIFIPNLFNTLFICDDKSLF